MNTIPELIQRESYTELMNTCEMLEIQSAVDASIDLPNLYPIYLASCVLNNDLQSTRHVRKRILQNKEVLNTPETQAIWQTITDLLKKSYPQVYQDLDSFQWTEYMQPLVEKIKQQTREHMFQLISKVYTSIELNQASIYFGLSDAETLQELLNRGWKYNETNKILYPVQIAPLPRSKSGSNHFERLADIVLNLEKH